MSLNADLILFVVLPYVAVALAVIVSVRRYFSDGFSFSSLSSQFLESGRLFWGSVAFHYGLLVVLAGHLIALLVPSGVIAFSRVPVRLFLLEATGLAFGLLALVGVVLLSYRRASVSRVRAVTSRWDVILLLLLLSQIATGVFTAIFHRWGAAWSVHTAIPYLWSLAALSPRPELVAALPLMARLHIINAFALIAIIPFTRLVHFLVVPVWYLWRPYQVVVWNRKRTASPGG
ncbi:MAG: respiratory nitrate reductase subunit gamma [Gemmatimonadota bacterium]